MMITKMKMGNLQYQIYREANIFYGQWLDELVRIYGHGAYNAIKKLEKKGLVIRMSDPENPKRFIVMTPQVKAKWDAGE